MQSEECNYYPLEKIHVLLLRSFEDITESIIILPMLGLQVLPGSVKVELPLG